MSRPKSGTPAGDKATAKWKATMIQRYGSAEKFHNKMVEVGRKGGSVNHPATRPFSVNHSLAISAGRAGGLISRKGKKENQ